MSHPSKKDLQIICNIQWKSKPSNGAHKVNIVGFADMPATTLSWDNFKSYLLTNSGISDGYDDIIVHYSTEDGREHAIQSQIDFQIALYTFRKHARMNEIIHLTLDRISDARADSKSILNSSEAKACEVKETGDTTIECSSYPGWFTDYLENGNPPKWFTNYMQEFKNTMLTEVDILVSGIIQNIKSSVVSQPSASQVRRCKTESKRARKHGLLAGDAVKEKDLTKLERKLESKLEKLEHKTKKIKEKKLALVCDSWFKDVSTTTEPSKTEEKLSAVSEDQQLSDDDYLEQQLHYHGVLVAQQKIAHVCVGEIYEHTWEICNGGTNDWNTETELRFTWGSKSLAPVNQIVPCPQLKPGETGKVTVQLIAPSEPGSYECYWHLYHHGKRFGDWFGCQVVVDSLKSAKSSEAPKPANVAVYCQNITSSEMGRSLGGPNTTLRVDANSAGSADMEGLSKSLENVTIKAKPVPDFKFDITSDNENLSYEEVAHLDGDSSDDLTDDYEFCNASTGKSLEDKYVDPVIPKVSEHIMQDNTPSSSVQQVNESQKDDDNNNVTCDMSSDNSSIVRIEDEVCDENKDMVFISFENGNKTEEYAYVLVDGKRYPIPKKVLKEDYLQTAEDAPNPCVKSEESGTQTATSSTNNESQTVESSQVHINVSQPYFKIPGKVGVLNAADNINSPLAENFQSAELSQDRLIESLSDSSSRYANVLYPELKPAHSSVEMRSCGCVKPQQYCSACLSQNYSYVSHCSAMGSCYSDVNGARHQNSRLFIFPQDCPGYEVVSPRTCEENICIDGSSQHKQGQEVPQASQAETSVSNAEYQQSFHDCANYAQSFQQGLSSPTISHCSHVFTHVPNFQQTHPLPRKHSSPGSINEHCISQQPLHQHENVHEVFNSPNYASSPTLSESCRAESTSTVHILPETLVTGAVNVASSAINTARSVINMIVPKPEPGQWVNGHWVSTNLETAREANLRQLAEMGFYNRDLNATLLARYNDDIVRVISELIQ